MAKSKAQTHQTNGWQLSYFRLGIGIFLCRKGELNLVLKLDKPLTYMTFASSSVQDYADQATYLINGNDSNVKCIVLTICKQTQYICKVHA